MVEFHHVPGRRRLVRDDHSIRILVALRFEQVQLQQTLRRLGLLLTNDEKPKTDQPTCRLPVALKGRPHVVDAIAGGFRFVLGVWENVQTVRWR